MALTFWQWIMETIIAALIGIAHFAQGGNRAFDHFLLLFLAWFYYVPAPAFYLMADSDFRGALDKKGFLKAIIMALKQNYQSQSLNQSEPVKPASQPSHSQPMPVSKTSQSQPAPTRRASQKQKCSASSGKEFGLLEAVSDQKLFDQVSQFTQSQSQSDQTQSNQSHSDQSQSK